MSIVIVILLISIIVIQMAIGCYVVEALDKTLTYVKSIDRCLSEKEKRDR